MDISVQKFPVQTQFANGVVERSETLDKLQEQHPKIELQEMLNKACGALNLLTNSHGFTSTQTVFGTNPKVTISSGLGAFEFNQEDETTVVGQRVLAIHTARQGHLESMTSDAIRKTIRTRSDHEARGHIKCGEEAYFWDDNGKFGKI